MKKYCLIVILGLVLSTTVFVSCKDDEFTSTIFDTTERPLDRTIFTFPLDTFCKANFLEPYNLKFIYRLEDIGSDQQKNLIPASYLQSKKLAVLTKYLWYEVYENHADKNFLKVYSPRIILLTGSPSVNATQHTETLGTAEGGLKVYLYKVNKLDENVLEGNEGLNFLFFHTMHHEFSHILDQNHQRPTAFDLLSNGKYDVQSWGEADDSLRAGQGFVTPYGSSQAREDWAEVMACYICYDELQWEELMNNSKYEWEEKDINSTQADSITRLRLKSNMVDTIGHAHTISEAAGTYRLVRKLIARNANGYAALKADGSPEYLERDGINGHELILTKLNMVRDWLKSEYNISLDKLREEVQNRTYVKDANGNFIKKNGKLVNHIVQPLVGDPSKTVIDSLLYQVDKYESLIER